MMIKIKSIKKSVDGYSLQPTIEATVVLSIEDLVDMKSYNGIDYEKIGRLFVSAVESKANAT